MRYKVTMADISFLLCMLLIYILPSYYFKLHGLLLSDVIVALFILIIYGYRMLQLRITKEELSYCFIVALIMLYRKIVTPLVLLMPLIVYHNYSKETIQKWKKKLLYSNWLYIVLIFVFVYSILGGLEGKRFLHTGLYEVNSSGLAVLLLGFIFYKRKKWLGILIIFLGCLSLSRNYILALVIGAVFSLKIVKAIIRKYRLYVWFSFKNVIILSSILLYVLGKICEIKYTNGEISYAVSFWERITHFFDISNYLRFTTNTLVIDVFNKNPHLWIFGGDNSEIQKYCYELAAQRGQRYGGNVPHNLLFSYLRLYGLAGVWAIFWINKVLRRIVNENNFFIFFIICVYSIFLGVGVNNYWLLLTVMSLLLYS